MIPAPHPQQTRVPTPEEDAQARLQATDPSRSFILQAPAGSGKTSVLVQRFLAVLATVKKPEQVLAITFTRKAAGEMQARIFEALKSAEGSPPAEPHRLRTYELARQVLNRSRQLQWELPSHPARLQIHTIDALCRKVVTATPLSSGVGAAPDLTDHIEPLISEALNQFAETMAPPGSSPQMASRVSHAYIQVLRHIGGNLSTLNRLLAEMLRNRERWHRDLEVVRHQPDDTSRQMAMERLSLRMATAIIQVVISEIRPAIEHLRAAGAPGLYPLPPEMLESLAQKAKPEYLWQQGSLPTIQPKDFEDDAPILRRLQAVRLTADWLLTGKTEENNRKLRSKPDHNMGFPKVAILRSSPVLTDLNNRMATVLKSLSRAPLDCLLRAARLPDPTWTDEQAALLLHMIEVLGAAEEHLQSVFARRNLCDFSEMSQRAIQALGEPWELTEVAERFDASFQHILIDEFQDTSHSQVALLAGLTKNWEQVVPGSPVNRTLFLVGDPMQSIYLFRQADVSLFLQAWSLEHLNHVPLEPLSLSINFRSDQGIVEFVNRAFGTILPDSDDLVTGEVTRRLALAHHGSGAGPVVTTNVAMASSADEDGDEPGVALSRSEVEFVVEQVREALSGADPHPSGEGEVRSPVAILVRARSHAAPLLEALRAAGIGITAIEMDSLVHRAHVRDMVQLAAALAHPGNRLAWTALLHSPAVGLTYSDLAILAGTVTDDFLPTPPRPDTEIDPTQPDPPLAKSRTSRAINTAIVHLISEPRRRSLLSAEGRRRLERALPTLLSALAQWERRPAHLLIEGAWIALGYPGCYPQTDPQALMQDIELVLDCIQGLESDGESWNGESLSARLEKLSPPTPLESRDRVTVCTIHKAKGLEWDTVLIPGIDRRAITDQAPLITYDTLTLDDEVYPLICPMADRDQRGINSLGRFLKQLRQRRLTAELRRLLYVAVTRARKRLVLTATTSRVQPGSFLEMLQGVSGLWDVPTPNLETETAKAPLVPQTYPPGVLPSSLYPPPIAPTADNLYQWAETSDQPGSNPLDRDHPAVINAMEEYSQACQTWVRNRAIQRTELQANPGLQLRHISNSWQSPSMPPRVDVPQLLRTPDRAVRQRLEDIRRTVLSGQVLIPGNAFHRIMHILARHGTRHPLPQPQGVESGGLVHELVRRALSLEGIPAGVPNQGTENPFHSRLRAIMKTTLANPALRWTFGFVGESELSVEGVQQGDYSRSRVDRTFEDPATGTRYIVDYKVVSHEGGGLEAFLEQKAINYSSQLERYAQLLPALLPQGTTAPRRIRLALFFAAQGRWAVWSPGQTPRLLPPNATRLDE